ncbi:10586_t:CDS:10 [Entrophospora sp. SA101]|nr:10586_t:CDS:10 [Entrophospora sp. SA101]
MSVLGHINKRIKSKSNIKLPLNTLINIVCTENVTNSNFVKNFAIMYLEMAYERITEEEQIDNLLSLIKNISSKPASQKQALIHIILPVLTKYKPKGAESPSSLDPYNFQSNSDDARFLLDSFLNVLLYHPELQARQKSLFQQSQEQNSGQQEGSQDSSQQAVQIPSGLSPASVKFVTNDSKAQWALKIADLKLIKIGILQFVNSYVVWPDSLPNDIHFLRFLVLLVASCDSSHEVVSGGEDGLKKLKKIDLESKKVVDGLFSLYQGSNLGKSTNTAQQDLIRQPASATLKYKIMNHLCKSSLATNTFPAMLQVSFDCLYGPTTNSKLQNQGMYFVQWVARMADASKLRPIALVLLSGLLKFIKELDDKETLRGFAYVAVSLLAKRDLSILQSFFAALSTESKNVKISVQEALSNMVEAFKDVETWADTDSIKMIEKILEENVEKPEHQARYCAIKYSINLFPFDHILSRYLCLLASSDEKLEVKEMASNGLSFPDPRSPKLYPNEPEKEIKIPSFNDLVNLIYSKSKQRSINLIEVLQTTRSFGKKYILGYRTDVYMNILKFLRNLIIASADPTSIIDELSFELGGGETTLINPNTRNLVKEWIYHQWIKDQKSSENMDIDNSQASGSLNIYLELVEKGLDNEGIIDSLLQSTAASCLLELISLGPSSLSSSYVNRIKCVIKLEVRNAMAHVLGIVSTSELEQYPERCQAIGELIKEFLNTAKDQSRQISSEYHHGCIIALGYIIGRLSYRYQSNLSSIVPLTLILECLDFIYQDLDSSKQLWLIGASLALGEACRYFHSTSFDNNSIIDKGKSKLEEGPERIFEKIIDKLIKLVKNTKDVKFQEAAIMALGYIVFGNKIYTEKVLSLYYDLAYSLNKQVEVHFTIGESITCIAAGWESIVMEKHLDIADVLTPKIVIEPDVMQNILNKLFNELLPTGKASVKKAICVWMLCLVKFCSKVASKGIGLVYELGDKKVKEQLVDSLVGMFGGKRPKETIENDTQLFDANILGQTPDGSTITTYQSILSLASDMNQPELVYKFMQLASHNAMWQSRKGAAFGFSNIISQAEKELEPYLKDLVPKLYRYQYDPNPRVNETMTSIWKVLVKDPKKATDDYFDIIIKDLLKGLGDRLWRTRESSANALTDLLQGRQIQQIEPYLKDLWTMCFRALDDIKESVRIAAFKTCRSLTKVTVKYCDPDNVSTAEGQKIMDIIMPFLLTKGLVSDAEDVRTFSLKTILKICKTAKTLLKSHITEIVENLLEGLSSMEPQIMSIFHIEKYDVSQEQLENKRLSATKVSPMMEGIESCIDYIDEKVLETLIPKLLQLIRKGVGLPTKAGCSKFVVSMCLKQAQILRQHADAIMRALSGAILDPSSTVRKSYAVAVGYLAHLTTDSTLIKYIEHVKKFYIENSEDSNRSITAISILEMSRHASDELKRIYVEVLPLTYYGMHDSDNNIKKIWVDIWEENTAGSTGAVKLYLKEIIELLTVLLESPSWSTKRQAALTIADVAKTIEQSLLIYMDKVLPLLITGLSGRTWVGKEALVEALTTASVSCKEYFKNNENLPKLNEIAKNNKEYKRHCISLLGKFSFCFTDTIDLYPEVKDFLIELMTGELDPDEMDVDDTKEKPLFFLIKANSALCIGMAWSSKRDIQELGTSLGNSLLSGKNVWNVRLNLLESLEKYIDRLDIKSMEIDENDKIEKILDEETLISIFKGLKDSLSDLKYVAIRTKSLEVLKKILERIKDPQPSISELAKDLKKII